MSTLYHSVQLPLFPTKACSTCHAEKPLEAFDKKMNQCRACKVERRRVHAQTVTITSKFCRGCSTEKPIEDFPVDASQNNGHRSRCRKCYNARESKQGRAWRKNNPEKAVLKSRRGRENNEEGHRVACREWHRKHPEYNYAREGRRRTRMYQGEYEEVDYKQIMEQNNDLCYICQKPIEAHHKIHLDHVIPLARGGTHTTSNIKPTHDICNWRKHTSLLEEMTPFQCRGPDV